MPRSVDESLFGSSSKAGSRQSSRGGSSVVNASVLSSLTSKPNTSIVSEGHYNIIRAAAMPEDSAMRTKESLRQQERRRREEEANKRLQAADNSRPPKQPTKVELEAARRHKAMIKKAKDVRDKDEDLVKRMDSLAVQARVFTVRDRQVALKARAAERAAMEKAKDAERISADHAAFIAEEKRKAELANERVKAASAALEQQIEDQERRSRLQKEARLQEMDAIKMRLEQRERAEAQKKSEEATRQRRLREEVDRVNGEVEAIKQKERERERLEDMQIMEYLKNKDEREAEQEREKEAARAARAMEISVLGDRQSGVQDRLEMEETVRLRRASEARDRKWRQEQLDKAKKSQAAHDEMVIARREQLEQKNRLNMEQEAQRKADLLRLKEERARSVGTGV
ncbi:hypothetical protein KIPB_005304 [Kipferlia bialata]|uniref:Cilia- and flagella-associated protein 45 n=1 Tax=Kipferlia bialata TaxID=797122 RepID=A0A9K3CWU0_9EUKA|nr:hypothetical protein KIPB_005304 [Kipferlia bialata]|eukprot:g5304.t1